MKLTAIAGCVLLFAVAGCSQLPGARKAGADEAPRPESVTDFATLYHQNCAACHGDEGRNAAAIGLANPVYEAWVSDAQLKDIITNGEPGTQMPAFAKSAGGFLADAQVDALVRGLRSHWQKPNALQGQTPPPYAATLKGDAAHGQQVYQAACARCHQAKGKSITGATYLALVNDQTLRSIIIAGEPDIGQPDWRGDIPGHALTDQEVTDVVAWLATHRSQTPGQPYAYPQ